MTQDGMYISQLQSSEMYKYRANENSSVVSVLSSCTEASSWR